MSHVTRRPHTAAGAAGHDGRKRRSLMRHLMCFLHHQEEREKGGGGGVRRYLMVISWCGVRLPIPPPPGSKGALLPRRHSSITNSHVQLCRLAISRSRNVSLRYVTRASAGGRRCGGGKVGCRGEVMVVVVSGSLPQRCRLVCITLLIRIQQAITHLAMRLSLVILLLSMQRVALPLSSSPTCLTAPSCHNN